MLKVLKPYRTFLIDRDNKAQVLYSWTLKGALEWASCSLRSDHVMINRYVKTIAYRSQTKEI